MFKAHSGKCLYKTYSLGHPIEVRQNWRYRWFHFGGLSIQSAMKRRKPSDLVLPYLAPMLAGVELLHPTAIDILLLGLGGGSIVRYAHTNKPAWKFTAIEIDPAVVEIAARYFNLPDENEHFQCFLADASDYIHAPHEPIDVIFSDIYSGEHLPDLLHEPKFFQDCFKQLGPNGLLCLNLVLDDLDEFTDIIKKIRDAFDNNTLLVPIPKYRNRLLFASKSSAFIQTLQQHASKRALRGLRFDNDWGFTADKIHL